MLTPEQIDFLELHADVHHCAPGLDPYHEPRCPHPFHDSEPKSRALRTHVWRSYVEAQTGNLRFMGAMCDHCGQQFRKVFFLEVDEMECP